MAAALLSIYSLCLLIMLTVLCVSILTFSAWPLNWPDPAPILSPAYLHGLWVALMVALVVISFIIWRLAMEGRRVNEALVHTRAILDEKRRVTALGALAAAAVHELGSPLGTIAVVAREMERDTHPDDPLAEDIALLRDQTEKCKKILADLARDPEKTLEAMAPLRFDRLLMEIISAQGPNERNIVVDVTSRVPENLPFLRKTPDLEYGLGNLMGNAISYARTSMTVTVEGSADTIEVTIQDDGPGFSMPTLQAVGQPYISTRETHQSHMGLGIFISVNLLEATGARLEFDNGTKGGATVRVIWPRNVLEAHA
jgi:two-component system sensor histidine kinase RegB